MGLRPDSSGGRPDAVTLQPWSDGDLPLLERVMGDPEMTKHLGGPESAAQIARRQLRYEALAGSGQGRMFKIVLESTEGVAAGSIGYWDKTWQAESVYEIGWSVLPEFQGQGIAGRALSLAVPAARSEAKHRFLHAFPSVSNPASNALCSKLEFIRIGEVDFEYPAGSLMRCNDWRLDLWPPTRPAPATGGCWG